MADRRGDVRIDAPAFRFGQQGVRAAVGEDFHLGRDRHVGPFRHLGERDEALVHRRERFAEQVGRDAVRRERVGDRLVRGDVAVQRGGLLGQICGAGGAALDLAKRRDVGVELLSAVLKVGQLRARGVAAFARAAAPLSAASSSSARNCVAAESAASRSRLRFAAAFCSVSGPARTRAVSRPRQRRARRLRPRPTKRR
ncbi:hypothetical protein [Burkholderia thailandensis]|uniref:hypothetical protein n=1 Tax=Burkholderia thailandensis TaxID=57975 RepID=UPI0021B1DA2A|nr:hypothetical protein [Burkholderia thailandensis]